MDELPATDYSTVGEEDQIDPEVKREAMTRSQGRPCERCGADPGEECFVWADAPRHLFVSRYKRSPHRVRWLPLVDDLLAELSE